MNLRALSFAILTLACSSSSNLLPDAGGDTAIGGNMLPRRTPSRALRVLVLHDGSSDLGGSPGIVAALRAAGHTVSGDRSYHEWDGTNPAPAGFDVILALSGVAYDRRLHSGGDAALLAFSAMSGKGIVFSEWFGYYEPRVTPSTTVATLLPVAQGSSYGSSNARLGSWRPAAGATGSMASYATGLPVAITASQTTGLTVKTGAVAIVEAAMDGGETLPAVTMWTTVGGARVVHINHATTYGLSSSTIDQPGIEMFVRSVELAGGV